MIPACLSHTALAEQLFVRHGVTKRRVDHLADLIFLAPDVVRAIVDSDSR